MPMVVPTAFRIGLEDSNQRRTAWPQSAAQLRACGMRHFSRGEEKLSAANTCNRGSQEPWASQHRVLGHRS